jgi:hypothetical protein
MRGGSNRDKRKSTEEDNKTAGGEITDGAETAFLNKRGTDINEWGKVLTAIGRPRIAAGGIAASGDKIFLDEKYQIYHINKEINKILFGEVFEGNEWKHGGRAGRKRPKLGYMYVALSNPAWRSEASEIGMKVKRRQSENLLLNGIRSDGGTTHETGAIRWEE